MSASSFNGKGVALVAILLAVSAGFGTWAYSRYDPPQTCGSPSPILPGYSQIISVIQQNATFLSLEHGKPYQFASVAQQQAQYNNGTPRWGNTVIEFSCGPPQCNPPIDAVVNSQGRIVQIYAARGGQISLPNVSSTSTATC